LLLLRLCAFQLHVAHRDLAVGERIASLLLTELRRDLADVFNGPAPQGSALISASAWAFCPCSKPPRWMMSAMVPTSGDVSGVS
jgi:hypothetical protein